MRDGTFEQKKALMQEYAAEILPRIKEKMDDLMTDYYRSGGRKAGDIFVNEEGPGSVNINVK